MPTTNPVPSTDPTDLLFNAGKLDEVVSGTSAYYTDRLGVNRRTIEGVNASADVVLAGIGYAPPVIYAAGISLTMATQTVEYAGEVYAPKVADLPFTTSGTFETAKFRLIQGVASADLPAFAGQDLQDYAALRAYTGIAKRIYITGQLVTAKPAGIAGAFQYDPTDTTSTDNGGTIIVGVDGKRWKRDYSGEVSVGWFGVSTSASASSNTAAIQAAANYCASNGQFLRGVAETYSTNGTLTINCSGDLSMMKIEVDARNVSPAIRVGLTTGDGNTARLFLDLKLPALKNSAKVVDGWSGFDTAVGVEVGNLYESDIWIKSIYGFGVGLSVGGYTAGNVHNKYHIRSIGQNKINLRIMPHGTTGWSNENTFNCGRLWFDAAEGSAVPGTRDILIKNFPGNIYTSPDNNLIIKPSVEGITPEYHIDIQGQFNTFINPRFEVPSGTPRVRFYSETSGETNSNLFIGGFKLIEPTYTFAGLLSPYNKYIGSRLNDAIEYTSMGTNVVVQTASAESAPHFQGFKAGQTALGKTASSTDWTYRIYAAGYSLKQDTDANARIRLDSTGRIYLGNGASAATANLLSGGSDIRCAAPFYPEADNTRNLGASTFRWSQFYINNIRPGSGSATWTSGAGSPEGAVAANVGSLYTRTDGAAGTTLYIKESGAGNTGWAAK